MAEGASSIVVLANGRGGTTPVSLFMKRSRLVSFFRLARLGGMVPVNWFSERRKSVKLVIKLSYNVWDRAIEAIICEAQDIQVSHLPD
jgi:hypothetical protein